MTVLHYTVDARDPREHRLQVSLELEHAGPGRLELLQPVWTPGSYLIREHQRHVSELHAVDATSGARLELQRTAKNRYAVAVPSGIRRVRIGYRVFAHELTVRTAHFTHEHAFWNGVSLFHWPPGHSGAAVVDVLVPPGWRVWTALPQEALASGAIRLRARDLDELIDSPVLATPAAAVVEFEALGRPHRFVLEGLGPVPPPPQLRQHTQAIVAAAAQVFATAELPYPRYDFLCLFTDTGRGGLEHADSSVLLAPRTALASIKGYRDFMTLVAHEHFHVFNVKRMRPAELWRLDYEQENLTRLLWVAEGFTAYYDDLLCRRADVLPRDRYLQIVADNIADAQRTPGRLVHPLAEASFDAWIKFYRPDEDTRNSTQSYYVNGGLAAMCLDLTIRSRTGGRRSLDDAMARLWQQTWCAGRGYEVADVIDALSHAAGTDMGPQVAELVERPFDPDFASLLAGFGLELVRVPPPAEALPHLGLELRPASTTVASVLRGGPAASAGIAAGDEILGVAGLRVSPGTWEDVLRAAATRAGAMKILLARGGLLFERQLTAQPAEAQPGYRIDLRREASAEQVALRRGWLAEPG